MTETGQAAYPLGSHNAVHVGETAQSPVYKETDKASMEMGDKQRSVAIKRGEEEAAADRRLARIASDCK
jgi:hypothetical protein